MKTQINRAAAQKELDKMKERIVELENIINVKRGDPTEWLKTFEDACDDQNIDVETFYKQCHDAGLTIDEIAYRELKIIVKSANGGWEPDWDNSNEYKYWPYFDMRTKSGFAFSFTYCAGWATYAAAGSRLVFKTDALCKYIATQFTPTYNKFNCK